MARLSRLLSAVSLGIVATAALAVTIATEYAPVHRTPLHLAESGASGRVIVKFRERASILSAAGSRAAAATGPQKASVLGARLGLALTDGRILSERTQVMKASGVGSTELAQAIAADPEVEWAVVDHRRYIQAAPVNDPLYSDNLSTSVAPNGPTAGQWYLRAPGVDASGHNVLSSIDIEPAWAITQGATSIVIADVDTGITAHPDLTAGNSKMVTGYDFIADAAVANDGDGRDADPSDPGDWVTATENSTKGGTFFGCNDDGTGAAVAQNSSWHGTQTAGILGASTDNATGMAGTAWNVPVIAARALGKCGGYDSDIIAAAEWAGGIAVSGVPANAHPARVINMSLGASGACTAAYSDAFTTLRDMGVVIVVAAGNDEGLPVGSPANCQPAPTSRNQATPVVIAVAALRHAGTKVGFSDIGPEVTLSAPGGNCINTASGTPCLYPIITARNSGTTTPVVDGGTYSDGLNNTSLGTSFATPMVAGTVALMLSANPNLTNQKVIDILRSTARPFPTTSDTGITTVCQAPSAGVTQDECICTTTTCGAGMLDAGAAVAAAIADSTFTGPAANYTWPTAAVTSTTTSTTVGSGITLDGSTSTPGSSGAAVTYKWSIPDGDNAIVLGASTNATVTVTGAAVGTGQVQLSVTDPASGLTNNTIVSVNVAAAPPHSGGGAANPAWLAALAAAGLLLRPRVRRARA